MAVNRVANNSASHPSLRWRFRRWVLAGALVLAVAACERGKSSDATAGSVDDDSLVTTYAEYAPAMVPAYCRRLFDCRDVSDDALGQRALYQTETRCVETTRQRDAESSSRASRYQQDLDSGIVGFDLDLARATLTAPLDCSVVAWDYLALPLSGLAGIGDGCLQDLHCAAGSYCDFDAGCGQCSAGPGEGQSCGGTRCAPPYQCSPETQLCIAPPRTVVVEEGEPCGSDGRAGDGTSNQCREGLGCSEIDGQLECQLPVPLGQDCSGFRQACADAGLCLESVDLTRFGGHRKTRDSVDGVSCE